MGGWGIYALLVGFGFYFMRNILQCQMGADTSSRWLFFWMLLGGGSVGNPNRVTRFLNDWKLESDVMRRERIYWEMGSDTWPMVFSDDVTSGGGRCMGSPIKRPIALESVYF